MNTNSIEEAAEKYSKLNYAAAPEQSQESAEYTQAVSFYSFKAGAEWQQSQQLVEPKENIALIAILKDLHSVEENQILGKLKETRRLLMKVIYDLSGVIKQPPIEGDELLALRKENSELKATLQQQSEETKEDYYKHLYFKLRKEYEELRKDFDNLNNLIIN